MGVYIKGMEMPKSCLACQLERHQDTAYDYEFRCCPVTGEMTNHYRNERAPRCPLVPVPPHGRLIDADALEMERRAENAKKGWHDSFAVVFNGDPYYEAVYDCTEQFKELVNNAPTIIPASEEGE